ncbi:MAG: outer-membrane lipoprotein carrier protein LolA [Rhodospirillales bacterium]
MRVFVLAVFLWVSAFSSSALAGDAVIDRALDTLNSTRSLYAKFKQYDQDGNRWTGQMWLKRPGKIRFQYDPPENDVIWSTGLFIKLYDAELETVTHIPVGLAPAWFLLEDPVQLDKKVEILAAGNAGKNYFLTASQEGLLANGKVTIIFEQGVPDQILGWTVVEDNGRTMHFNLINPMFGAAIDDEVFRYQPPIKADTSN